MKRLHPHTVPFRALRLVHDPASAVWYYRCHVTGRVSQLFRSGESAKSVLAANLIEWSLQKSLAISV